MKKIVSAASMFFCATTCLAAEFVPEPVRVRVANASEVPFSVLVLDLPAREDFGPLEPGQLSEYRSAFLAYRNPGYRIEAGGKSFHALTADHMGDTPLKAGAYTYTIDLYGERVVVGLIVDDE